MRNMIRKAAGWLAGAVLLAACSVPCFAVDTEASGGQVADALTVKVGYFGGPYYEKKVLSLSELEALPQVKADYTIIDAMPSVVIDHVRGVRLADVVEAAGIDLGSVETFYFWTRDKTSDYYTSFKKTELIDRPRYCYYSLPDNFDYDAGQGNAFADSAAERVDTVISLADDWKRCIAGAEFGSDYTGLDTSTRFRLIFGQTNTYERTASRSARWIHEIVVELGGAPVITLDAPNLEGEVGSVLCTSARISAADSAIAAGLQPVWSSSDETVAVVDAAGQITIVGEGSAVITASAGGASASLTVNGSGTPEASGGAPGGTADPGADPEQKSSPAEELQTSGEEGGRSYELITGARTEAGTPSLEGGVQNWRVYEMSETAQALADVDEDSPLTGVMGAGAGVLFLAAFTAEAVRFRKNIQ